MELNESEDLLRNTIDSSVDMIQVFKSVRDEHGEIVDFIWILNNKASEKVYGDVIGKSLLNLNPGVIEEGIFDTFKKVVETGEPDQSVRHYVHEQFDGWYLQSAVKQDDGVATTTKDITDLKKAEQAEKQSQALLNAVINAPNIGIAVYKAVRNSEGKIVDFLHEYINRGSIVMLGEDWTGRLFTEHGENALLQIPQFSAVIETGEGNSYVRKAQFRGQEVWFAITNTPLDNDRLVHTWEDITERKNAEQEILRLTDEVAQKATDKYKALFDSIDEGFAIQEVVTDEKGDVTDVIYREVNGAFEQLFGMKDVPGRKASELLPHLEQHWLDMLTQVYKTGKPLRGENYTADLGRWFTYHFSQIGGIGSPLIGVVFNDVTERKQREQQQQYIVRLSDALHPLADPMEVQRVAMRVLGEHLNVDRSIYAEINIDEDWFEAIDNYTSESVEKVTGRFPFSAFGPPGEKLKAGESLVIHNVHTDVDDDSKIAYYAMNVHAVVAVPLIKEGKLVADLSVHQTTPRHWRENEIGLIYETAERTWAAVERAKAEQCLRKSEEQFRRAIEDAPIPVIMHAEDGEVLQLSRTWTELTGFTLTDISNFDLWLSTAYSEGADVVRDHMHELFDRKKRSISMDFPITALSGEVRHWSFSASSPGILKDGRRFIVGMAVDITDRKRHEEHLRNFNLLLEQQIKERTKELQESKDSLQSIFDTTLVGMSVFAPVRDQQGKIVDFRIVSVNKKVERATGRTDLIGQLYGELFPGIRQMGLFDLMVKTIETGNPGKMEYHYTYEGIDRWYSTMFVKGDDILVSTNMDITERIEAQQKIKKMEAEQQREIFRTSLATLEEERYRISESLHNGIGQILYGVKINMHNLKPDSPEETFGPAKAYVNKLLTDAIAETRRISHELMPTTLEQFGLKSAIDDICLQLTDETKFNCHISGLQNRLEKYMELAVYRTTQELMTNVVKHAGASACEVNIIVGNEKVKISVNDNGKGMQVDADAGKGIGLASIRSKVKLLDGQVNISSVSGGGTSIEVVIPHQGFVNK